MIIQVCILDSRIKPWANPSVKRVNSVKISLFLLIGLYTMMIRFCYERCTLAVLLAFCLAGCSVLVPQPTATQTPTITLTPTLSSTPTQTATASPTVTPSPTPTLTPTPELWALPNTPLPADLISIRTDNAQWVSGLSTWQETTVTDLEWMPPDKRVLSVVNGERVKFYDIYSRQLLRELYPQGQPVVDIAFNPRGNWLVSASRRGSEREGFQSSLELWLGPDWKPMGLLYDAPRAISNLVFSPDGLNMATTFASAIENQNSLEIWSTTGWQITGTLSTGTALQSAFAPGIDLLAVTPDRYAIRIWNIEEETWQYTLFTSFTGAVTQIAFSPDGGVLASGHYDGLIRIWDMRTGTEILNFPTGAVVESLTFSSDGRLLASGGSFEDNLVRIWDAGNGELLRELVGHQAGVVKVLFSPDSQFLVSASYDGMVRLWGIRP